MKAAMYYNQQDIRIEEIAKPEINDDEILVQMKACGLCGSDLMDWYLKPRAPIVLGHEPAVQIHHAAHRRSLPRWSVLS